MRRQALPEEFLSHASPTIVIGKVLEINANAMPTRAKVLLSIKGNAPLEERDILPKSPGKVAIFPEEFDKAKKGEIGVFFVGSEDSPRILMKYKDIPYTSTDYETTAKLPADQQIWPIPEVETTKDIFSVGAEFVESTEILSVTQGNWRKVTYLVKYRVTKKDKRYPYEEIIFIAKDTWPAKGSNIRVKKMMWPFKKGKKFFYLKKDDKCKFKAYFDILTYS